MSCWRTSGRFVPPLPPSGEAPEPRQIHWQRPEMQELRIHFRVGLLATLLLRC